MSTSSQKKPTLRQFPAQTAGGPQITPARAPKAAPKPAEVAAPAAAANPSQKEEVILKLIEFLKTI